MPSWPAQLFENPVRGGYMEGYDPETIQTEVKRGPVFQRQRSVLEGERIRGRFVLKRDDIAVLETFYFTALGGGCLTFDWAHPRTGEAVRARFDTSKGVAIEPAGDDFQVEFDIDIMP